jgi:hypothetical protein
MAAVQETENPGKVPAASVVAPRPAEGTGGPKLRDRAIGGQHTQVQTEIRMGNFTDADGLSAASSMTILEAKNENVPDTNGMKLRDFRVHTTALRGRKRGFRRLFKPYLHAIRTGHRFLRLGASYHAPDGLLRHRLRQRGRDAGLL